MNSSSLFDSAEKEFIRDNQWGKALYGLVEGEQNTKVLEFLGTRWHFWKQLKENNLGKEVIVDGVTLENDIPGKEVYDKIFIGRYDALIKNQQLIERFPYQLVNLDYCGGGRYFDDKFRYYKFPEITKTIELSLQNQDKLHLLITLDTADYIYPIMKSAQNSPTNLPIWKEVDAFLESIANLDVRPYWLMIIGNALELADWCVKSGYSVSLQTDPYTYIARSIGHKTRMISYYFLVAKETAQPEAVYSELLRRTINTFWLELKKSPFGNKITNARSRYL